MWEREAGIEKVGEGKQLGQNMHISTGDNVKSERNDRKRENKRKTGGGEDASLKAIKGRR